MSELNGRHTIFIKPSTALLLSSCPEQFNRHLFQNSLSVFYRPNQCTVTSTVQGTTWRSVLWASNRGVHKMRKGDSYASRLLGGGAPASCVGQPRRLLLLNRFNSRRTRKGKNSGCKPERAEPVLHLCHRRDTHGQPQEWGHKHI